MRLWGVMLERGDGVEWIKRAAAVYTKACESGQAIACVGLGRLLSDGVGQDDAAAIQEFQRGAGWTQPGCTAWAKMLDGGFGVDRNFEAAVANYHRGCDGGDAEACVTLARRLGALQRADYALQVQGLWSRACLLDEAEACFREAQLRDADQTAEGRRAARDLRRRACTLGFSEACK